MKIKKQFMYLPLLLISGLCTSSMILAHFFAYLNTCQSFIDWAMASIFMIPITVFPSFIIGLLKVRKARKQRRHFKGAEAAYIYAPRILFYTFIVYFFTVLGQMKFGLSEEIWGIGILASIHFFSLIFLWSAYKECI